MDDNHNTTKHLASILKSHSSLNTYNLSKQNRDPDNSGYVKTKTTPTIKDLSKCSKSELLELLEKNEMLLKQPIIHNLPDKGLRVRKTNEEIKFWLKSFEEKVDSLTTDLTNLNITQSEDTSKQDISPNGGTKGARGQNQSISNNATYNDETSFKRFATQTKERIWNDTIKESNATSSAQMTTPLRQSKIQPLSVQESIKITHQVRQQSEQEALNATLKSLKSSAITSSTIPRNLNAPDDYRESNQYNDRFSDSDSDFDDGADDFIFEAGQNEDDED
ncbi:hypothetical protein BKA69DRAFT_1121637 [Paraphysoderma sedebokerense]|nr:hypothetical protein BKA69DRAFT_1121637 [Paraphysoderma sedebokerense]